jgi:succinoglycan biosynthesis protein ExoL
LKKTLIIIFTPTRSQPRFHKRISKLKEHSEIIVFSFRRGFYENNNFDKEIKVYDLGLISDGKYLKRLFPFIKALFLVRNKIPKNYKNIKFYSFSLDCLFLAKISGLKYGFLEIGDLPFTNTENRFLKYFEKAILTLVNGVIITSSEYFNSHYKFLVDKNHHPLFYVIENRLPLSLKNKRIIKNESHSQNNKIPVIGLIGFLRFKKPIEKLINFIKEYPNDAKLKVFGDGPLKYLIEENLSNNIEYFGSFKSPQDLHKIYKQLDINFVVYDPTHLNERIAIPNKLYESAFFRVPLICSPETYLSKLAIKWKIGETVSLNSQKSFNDDMLKRIDINWIQNAKEQCTLIPDSQLLDNQNIIIRRMLLEK